MTTIDLLNQALQEEGTVLLDGTGGRKGSASLLFRRPREILVARTPADVLPVLEAVEQRCRAGLHAAGFLAYEAGAAFWADRFPSLVPGEPLPAGVPLVWFGIYEDVLSLDEVRFEASEPIFLPFLHPEEPQGAFEQRVRDIRHLIHEGDVYQVNHTTRFRAVWEGDPVDLYRALRTRQPVAWGGLLRCGDFDILSFSPELFFDLRGQQIEAEPMKGTAPRGGTREQDEQLARWLEGDEKNRAENLMIVDLLRNDLSVVCEPGSVRVPERFTVRALPSVHQMTSRVSGQLRPDVGLPELMRALFPCGSITGAPKLRAMRRIAELESGPRGVYCGAIGYVTGSGAERRSVFSVAIRTAVLSGTDLTLGAGGGIVWDSDPAEEYRETLLKTRFFGSEPLAGGVQLIETLRANAQGKVPWLAYHRDRLRLSAAALGFALEDDAFEAAVHRALVSAPGSEEGWRIRLLLSPDGTITAEARPFEDAGPDPLPICLSGVRMASTHPRYHHKTTDRGPYEEARRMAREVGCFDALLVNERDEITEGAITNVFIREGESWYTPPLSSGLLPGIGRRVFLLRHAAKERILRLEDLRRAEEIRVTNAVIGERPARWVELDG
ncbi:MAG: aminodeoxychorismate synthase component I [Bacteroidetes bacterium]|nr:aminodeoxychorismate synthase component I [Bacteroidota bacterium]MDA0874828.1 aminodeoxychorismate synthase component I [Bacteroidota bacterium]